MIDSSYKPETSPPYAQFVVADQNLVDTSRLPLLRWLNRKLDYRAATRVVNLKKLVTTHPQDATDALAETVDKRVDDLQCVVALLEARQAQRMDALITGIVIGGALVLLVVTVALGS